MTVSSIAYTGPIHFIHLRYIGKSLSCSELIPKIARAHYNALHREALLKHCSLP